MFRSVQGEGFHAGRPAVFIRFSGCNVWSGREEDRQRDAKKGTCALFCDTQFAGVDESQGGGYFTAREIVERIVSMRESQRPTHLQATPYKHNVPVNLVVLTGGEPTLQVDASLVQALQWGRGDCTKSYVAIETNGSREINFVPDWITLSPKPPMPVVKQHYSEVKVLYPEYEPQQFYDFADIHYVQPVDPGKVTFYLDIWRDNMRKCVQFVNENPEWGISVQMHKVLDIP
jgi:7-carboxy-7-deazaguanine synthase